ncbi:hypothetical protein [Methylocella silvestris]|uniref:Uncharacterized protein n=1 Tax=Methylocella silvestris TaxID=199596 RepID=A0A2J7TBW6_METSI|nr:hypothetical protein [Methylocella silvestris]PNG24261.1 hypothetical protein CR492_19675 [Methylocella silvestris]
MTAFGESSDQIAVASTGRFEDDQDIALKCVEPGRDSLQGIGDPVDLSVRYAIVIDEGARKIEAGDGLVAW